VASEHLPVLTDRVVELLTPAGPGLLVDATVGLGGHAEALLRAEPEFQLVGLDRDPQALARAGEILQPFSDRVQLVEETFDRLPQVLRRLGLGAPVAVLADIGCSSLQLDSAERGFSFASDGPLDMRMGGTGPTVADLLERAEWEELVRILRERTTAQLSHLVQDVMGGRERRIHPATRTFQALRIAVNDELGQLERFLEPAIRSLKFGGRIVVISFHSLEDRIVKHTLRRLAGRCTCPPDFPVCRCNPQRVVEVLTSSPVRPDEEEIDRNPRARSARLRAAQKRREN
jgi:16S rRNA (cytosine1402-N4)-methyltransferase